jgi:SAM-dependent methyltransferase
LNATDLTCCSWQAQTDRCGDAAGPARSRKKKNGERYPADQRAWSDPADEDDQQSGERLQRQTRQVRATDPALLRQDVLQVDATGAKIRWRRHAVRVSSDEVSAATSPAWTWDPSLYAGSARFYAVGRVRYPAEVGDVLIAALGLDGSGRLLDVGCGPGSLTLLLAPHFTEAIGIDADADMLLEAARLAEDMGVRNVGWWQLRGEDLPADLPPMRAVSFAQSFHWMDRRRVAAAVRGLLVPGGAVVHVHATTHEGVDTDAQLPHPRPPRDEVTRLVHRYLGPRRRAGQGVLIPGKAEDEDAVYRGAGLTGPQRVEVAGQVVERTAAEVAASIYSLSGSAPHLFGDRFAEFDAQLRQLLADAGDDGLFSEHMRSIALDIWR